MNKDYKKLYEDALERAKYLKENTDSVGALDVSANFEYIFPELKESEDEKIKSAAIEFVKQNKSFNYCLGVSKEEIVAWLKKQGKQKSEVKYVYPKFRVGDVIVPIKPNGYYVPERVQSISKGYYNCKSNDNKAFSSIPICREDEYKLYEQKPAEWSEEDEKHYQGCLNLMRLSLDLKPYPYYNDYLWLKLLKPQSKQEWSEEDIEKMVKKRALSSGTTASEMTFYRQGIEDTIKSLKPNHWKPSEEQMEALKFAANDYCMGEIKKNLESLYNSLLKL